MTYFAAAAVMATAAAPVLIVGVHLAAALANRRENHP